MKSRLATKLCGFLLLAGVGALAHGSASQGVRTELQDFARDSLRELIEIDTTATHGTLEAAEAISRRLIESGFAAGDIQLLAPSEQPSRANVVIRMRGRGHAPALLVIAHLDVVEAPRESWSVDPFHLTEKDGYFYGRGTLDLKGEDAALVTALARMKRERYRAKRDIIVAFTADEEAGSANGVQWLLKNHRDLIAAGLAINPDEGAAAMRDGQRIY